MLKNVLELVRPERTGQKLNTFFFLSGSDCPQVEVSEQNINVPHSSCGNLTVDLDELTPLGTKVLHLKDRCSDTDKNGPVVFYASPESKLLHVVPRGGQVVLVGSLLGLSHVELRLYAKDGGDAALAGEPVFLHVNVLKHQLQRRKRTRRNVSEEPNFTVMVPDQAQVGDLVFTVPELRFQQRWFEVIPEAADSPVQIERDSGRLFLARHLQEPEDVTVKIQNRRGRNETFFFLISVTSFRWSSCLGPVQDLSVDSDHSIVTGSPM